MDKFNLRGLLVVFFVFSLVATLGYPLMVQKSVIPQKYDDPKENIQESSLEDECGALYLFTNKIVFEESVIGVHLVFKPGSANSSFFIVQVMGDYGLVSRFQGYIDEGIVPQFSFLSPSLSESKGINLSYTMLPNWIEGPPYSSAWSIDRMDIEWRNVHIEVINEYATGDKTIKLYLILLEGLWVITAVILVIYLNQINVS